MTIDTFTYVAQLINFLVLVWLLKHFLYGPVTRAMQDREARMAARVEEVQAAKSEAERTTAEYRQRLAELERTREQLLAQAAREIEEWKQQHLQQARAAVDKTRQEWYRGLQRERDAFLRDLRERAGRQVHDMSRDVLRKLADVSLERTIIDSFLGRIRQLAEDDHHALRRAIEADHAVILVETGFDLSEEGEARIRRMLAESLTGDADLEFRVDPSLICGIELKAGGFKIAWSVRETLETLEEEFSRLLDDARPQ